MQEAGSDKTTAKKNVAAFTADHGVNPGWGVYEERPLIPAFNGVAEIGKLAMLLTLWVRIEDFLYKEIGIRPQATAKDEKKYLAVLLESETFLVALLCLLNNEHYSASSLVDAMVGVNASADQRGNARKRILNRTLPIVGDHYGLFDYSERHMGNSMEYSICRSQRLVDFAEANLVTGINDILGDVTAGNSTSKPVSKVSKKSTAKRSAAKKPVNAKTRRAKSSAVKSKVSKPAAAKAIAATTKVVKTKTARTSGEAK